MTLDVSYLLKTLGSYNDNRTEIEDSTRQKSTAALMTLDLLGNNGCGGEGGDDQSLDLDLQVPTGWEKRLDLTSGKVYLQQCNSSSTSSSSSTHHNQTVSKFQDLNFPPVNPLLSLFDDTSLELKLVSSSSSLSVSSANSSFNSVCTLDKVKSALERANNDIKKRKLSDDETASPVAAGCPGCLTYVLVMKNNPECPRCHSSVPLPAMKKPKIDLNISI